MKLGIIGGEGKMGRLFKKIFERYVDETLTSSYTEEIVQKADIVVFSVPIEVTPEVIGCVSSKVREDQLLLDFTSLKAQPCAAMMETQGSVIGMHPMFGPSVASLKGQTVVLCPERPRKWLPWLKELLEKEEAHVIETDPQTHDEMMAIVQCLVHFTSMVFTEAMRMKGIDPKKLAEFASPVYRMQLNIAGRIMQQSPDLYRAIQFENPSFPDVLASFEKAFDTLSTIVERKDTAAFGEVFKEAGDYLGERVK